MECRLLPCGAQQVASKVNLLIKRWAGKSMRAECKKLVIRPT
jgi:hypothetical protein